MFRAILRAIQNAVAWLFEFILEGVGDLVSGIGSLVPGLDAIDFGPISSGLAAANQYVPLDLLFLYLGLYAAFVFGFATVKIIIKLIPFLG